MIIKEYKSIYEDKAEEICNYVKSKINDDGWIDTDEIYVADTVDDEVPLIIIPTFIDVMDLDSTYADTGENVINKAEFILILDDTETSKCSIVCEPDDWYGWSIDIVRHTDLDTAIKELNEFLSNPISNFENNGLQVIE